LRFPHYFLPRQHFWLCLIQITASKMKIAVIGSGISGLAAAWLISTEHQVVIYEKNDYLGGHTNTAEITQPSNSKEKKNNLR
jgi:predicted NAD/FAD-binding protein